MGFDFAEEGSQNCGNRQFGRIRNFEIYLERKGLFVNGDSFF
jgi:hypothetical protein